VLDIVVVLVVVVVVVGGGIVGVVVAAVSLSGRFRRCDAVEDCCAVKGSAN
jgi:hypothetical protein